MSRTGGSIETESSLVILERWKFSEINSGGGCTTL